MTKIEAILSLVALIIVVALVLFWHHSVYSHGYTAGQAERVAYYEPLMKAAIDAKNEADKHTAAIVAAAKQVSEESEAQHAKREVELAARADAAGHRFAVLLQDHARACAGRGAVPAAPGSAGTAAGATAGDERTRHVAGRIAGVGFACEHDAATVAAWQDWYARQRALRA